MTEQVDQKLARFAAEVETHLEAIREVRRKMESAGHHDLVVVANLAKFMELFILDFTFLAID